MSDEELRSLWQSNRYNKADNELILSRAKAGFEEFERIIKRRDRREVITALLMMPAFVAIALFVQPVLSKIGAALIVPVCIYIIYNLRKARKNKPADPVVPLLPFLQQYKTYLLAEMKLLDSVLYWYILPCIVPLLLFFIGLEKYWFALLLLPLAVGIYYLNKKAARHHFQPLISRVDAEIASLNAA